MYLFLRGWTNAKAATKAKLEEGLMARRSQWAESEGNYTGISGSKDRLQPGMYDIVAFQNNVFFVKTSPREDELLRFPDSTIDDVVSEIEIFWTEEAAFRKHELPYKRGLLLYGPPGSGKSSTFRLIASDVVKRNGVVLTYGSPDIFLTGYRILREIEPNTPIVVLMEDLDTILEAFSETKVLNLLDGIEEVDKVVFLASTNYPQNLGARIVNRPSRFDRKFKIGHPQPAARRMYFENLIRPGDDVDIDRWVKDTEGLSLAHLKELFVATIILHSPYDETLTTLRKMKEKVSSFDDEQDDVAMGQYA